MKILFKTSGLFSAVFLLLVFLFSENLFAQREPVAPAQDSVILVMGGNIHVGNGQVISNGNILIENGKITQVNSNPITPRTGVPSKIINAKGKDVYPALIAPNSILGLSEIGAIRATNDVSETGEFNPGTRSLIAYNTDSKVIPTVRSNGVLLVQVVPQGGTISGASSIMQLDAWNWEDAQYKADDGIHLNWPSFFKFDFANGQGKQTLNDDYEKQVDQIRDYFQQAKAYNADASHDDRNINFEAMKGLFDGTKTLFIHVDFAREIMNAIQFAHDFNLKMVIVGGQDSYLCTEALKNNNVAVILGNVHSLPSGDDVDVDIPYRTAAMLHDADVLYCLSIGGSWPIRNLAFMCGTSSAYGIPKEDALKSITSNTAKILGIDNRTGTIESGKDANIIISSGDIMDMKANNIEYAFIQGRQIDLDNFQKELYHTYMKKYGLKE
jgi:imidazolonepropionase-like amidohydrolase